MLWNKIFNLYFLIAQITLKKIIIVLRIHLRLSTNLKTSVWTNIFYMQKYEYSENLFNTLYIDKRNITKNSLFPFTCPSLSVLLSIHNSFMSWSARFVSWKRWNLDFLFSIPFFEIFFSTKIMGFLTFKSHNSFIN